uniref:Uncharacterized protein n=1 Tax=Rhizophora mucronata TaxID=61149 RepID=A0A2P2N6R6_RHIMU
MALLLFFFHFWDLCALLGWKKWCIIVNADMMINFVARYFHVHDAFKPVLHYVAIGIGYL